MDGDSDDEDAANDGNENEDDDVIKDEEDDDGNLDDADNGDDDEVKTTKKKLRMKRTLMLKMMMMIIIIIAAGAQCLSTSAPAEEDEGVSSLSGNQQFLSKNVSSERQPRGLCQVSPSEALFVFFISSLIKRCMFLLHAGFVWQMSGR